MQKPALLAALLTAALLSTGCSVRVQKDEGGQDKDVSIHTPFGGLQVQNNAGNAASMGLPLYPGAVQRADDGNDKSVNLTMGFGPWMLHVQAANYAAGAPQAQVQSFYLKALGAYGQVLTCNGRHAVGVPTRTGAGLTCDDDHGRGHGVDIGDDGEIELKAGSPNHQRIVAFKNNSGGRTLFSLVEVTLPENLGHSSDHGPDHNADHDHGAGEE